jgi:hypothetical protein
MEHSEPFRRGDQILIALSPLLVASLQLSLDCCYETLSVLYVVAYVSPRVISVVRHFRPIDAPRVSY